jgi:hypothetical protein
MEAAPRIELGMWALQALALPLGYAASIAMTACRREVEKIAAPPKDVNLITPLGKRFRRVVGTAVQRPIEDAAFSPYTIG